eukprot:scaffold42738_cov65-Phaeocystis_antarctica.AAC.1
MGQWREGAREGGRETPESAVGSLWRSASIDRSMHRPCVARDAVARVLLGAGDLLLVPRLLVRQLRLHALVHDRELVILDVRRGVVGAQLEQLLHLHEGRLAGGAQRVPRRLGREARELQRRLGARDLRSVATLAQPVGGGARGGEE